MGFDDTRRRKAVTKVLSTLLAVASVVAAGHGVAAEPGNGKGGGQDNGGGGGGGKPTTTTSTTSSTTTSTTSTTLAPSGAEIAVAIDDDADPAVVGEILAYTVTVDNVGSDAVDNVATVVWIRHSDVRGTFSYEAVTPSQGSCTTPVVSEIQTTTTEESYVVECGLGTVGAGGRVTVTITGRPTFVTRSTERFRPALSARVYDQTIIPGGTGIPDSDFEYTGVTLGDPTYDCLLEEAWPWTSVPHPATECLQGVDGGALPGGG